MKIKEGDLVRILYEDETSGEELELVVEVLQIMDKILVKEPDDRSYLEGGHRPFLLTGDEILEVVEPVEKRQEKET